MWFGEMRSSWTLFRGTHSKWLYQNNSYQFTGLQPCQVRTSSWEIERKTEHKKLKEIHFVYNLTNNRPNLKNKQKIYILFISLFSNLAYGGAATKLLETTPETGRTTRVYCYWQEFVWKRTKSGRRQDGTNTWLEVLSLTWGRYQ